MKYDLKKRTFGFAVDIIDLVELLLTRRLLNVIIILISQKYIKTNPSTPNNWRARPNLPFRKGEELKTPSLFEKGGLGWVKKNYWFITAGLIPKNNATNVISYQLLKCGTSVGANYRAAKRARSDKEFIAKVNIVLEEADETLFWLEIIKIKKWIDTIIIERLLTEADELTAIFVSTLKTMNSKRT